MCAVKSMRDEHFIGYTVAEYDRFVNFIPIKFRPITHSNIKVTDPQRSQLHPRHIPEGI